MKSRRRDFIRSIGMSAGAFAVFPDINSKISGEGLKDVSKEDEKKIYRKKEFSVDVAVIGGGMSGICAAIAAARNGSSVVLIQDRSRLGGNASSEIRMHVSGASVLETVWREVGILEELMLDDAVLNGQKAYPMWDFVLYDKVISEPNITLLLDTLMWEVEMEEKRIRSIKAYCSQNEEIYEVKAQYFADCTGDATLAALAGAECMRGREAKSEWEESLALETADDASMGNSLLFTSREFDRPMPFMPPKWARKYSFKDFEYRPIHSFEYGYWWLELAGKYNIIKDGHELRHELLAVLFGVWDYIKNSGNYPESENWALTWVGMIPGKRESRRIIGDIVLSQRDVQASQNFTDRVAYGGWPLDDHPAEGMENTSIPPNRAVRLKGPYSIPLRALYSKNIENLWMAGRNISVSHVALSSTRVMATCATIGQAIGTAMNYCIQNKKDGRTLAISTNHIQRLQQILLRQDQSILNVENRDEKDFARKATVKCSHEAEEGKAINVIDGINRNIEDGRSHQWRAEMGSRHPWIELSWKAPVDINTVEFTFDTGLHRYLRISAEKVVMDSQIRRAQPETVSDFKIECFHKGRNVYSDIVSENYYRKVAHPIPSLKADRLRLTVLRTHGDLLARIFEIRCYNEK